VMAPPVTSSGAPRVLMFHTTLPEPDRKIGGVEVAVHRLANALVQLGVPVTVASLSTAPDDARYTHRRLFPRSRWLRDSHLGRLVVLPVLLNRLAVDDTDVVHFHGDDWFTLRRPRPTVRTLHGTALREAQQATRMLRRLEQYLLVPAERIATRLATTSVAVGADAASVHGLSRVIGNGVDRTLFRPGSKSERPSILYVGTWNGRKRGRWLNELFVEHIAPRRPDVELHFVADREPPAHPQVRYSRFPDDDALARAYREAWVFALPSTYEGFGIPYLEAMASGTPVLATPNPGAIELLGNGRFGVLADDEDFADALQVLLGDAGARARLAEAGLERAREYDWSEIAKAYRAVYVEAVQHAQGARVAARASALAPVGR
jgi:phosphatidylinositol alpha-mannosyltransferase